MKSCQKSKRSKSLVTTPVWGTGDLFCLLKVDYSEMKFILPPSKILNTMTLLLFTVQGHLAGQRNRFVQSFQTEVIYCIEHVLAHEVFICSPAPPLPSTSAAPPSSLISTPSHLPSLYFAVRQSEREQTIRDEQTFRCLSLQDKWKKKEALRLASVDFFFSWIFLNSLTVRAWLTQTWGYFSLPHNLVQSQPHSDWILGASGQ